MSAPRTALSKAPRELAGNEIFCQAGTCMSVEAETTGGVAVCSAAYCFPSPEPRVSSASPDDPSAFHSCCRDARVDRPAKVTQTRLRPGLCQPPTACGYADSVYTVVSHTLSGQRPDDGSRDYIAVTNGPYSEYLDRSHPTADSPSITRRPADLRPSAESCHHVFVPPFLAASLMAVAFRNRLPADHGP